jgi:imidazolonepropionase-like amidohydrolase
MDRGFTMAARAVLAGVLAAFAAAAAAQEAAGPEPATAYVHATLIDGRGGPARPDMAVVVRGERIVAVVPSAEARSFAPDARLVDMTGRWVLPGLIDSHVHISVRPSRAFAEANLRRDLYGGITAERDMGGDSRLVAEMAREARDGEIAAPDIVFAVFLAGRSYLEADPWMADPEGRYRLGEAPWIQAVDAGTDIAQAVAVARGTGASAVKIYANLPPAQVKAIAAEARRQGLKVWAHSMVFPTTPAEVLDARPDTMEHSCYLGYQAMSARPKAYHDRARIPVDPAILAGDDPALAGLLARMKSSGVILDATITVFELVERMRADPRFAEHKPPIYCSSQVAAEITARAYRAGVGIAAGTDAGAEPADPWPSLQGELELLVRRAGMSPSDAIVAATATGARAMGREHEMGTIQVGKLANLVFVTANPLDDIAALRKVELTIKRGQAYARRDYRQPKAEDLDRNR